MTQLDGRGPGGTGAMTGRKRVKCSLFQSRKSDDEIKKAIAGLIAVVIIGITEIVWNWIKDKRLQSGSK